MRSPTWHDSIPDAIQLLEASDSGYVQSQTLAEILGIGPRRAQQLISKVPMAQRDTRGYILRTEDAILWLQSLLKGESLDQEMMRRRKFGQWLAKTEKTFEVQGKGGPIVILEEDEARKALSCRCSSLPSSISFLEGEVRIQFQGFEDLMGQLYSMAQAALHEPEEFQERLGFEQSGDRARRRPGRGCSVARLLDLAATSLASYHNEQ